jgi:hypothetical protein
VSAFVVGASLDHDVAPTVSDVIGPFTDASAAFEFVRDYCPPQLLDCLTRWHVVSDESCQYSPQAWIALQQGDSE